MLIGVAVAAFSIAASSNVQGGGFVPGVVMLGMGIIYVIVFGGMCYLGLGIYHNTKRNAEAAEKLLKVMTSTKGA